MGKSQMHEAKRKKPDSKGSRVLWFHFHDILDKAKLLGKKTGVTAWGWGYRADYKGAWDNFLEWGKVLYLDCSDNHRTVYICQNTKNYKLKRVNFTACKLYLNKLDIKKSSLRVESCIGKPHLVKSSIY